jgi:hypothetical protein
VCDYSCTTAGTLITAVLENDLIAQSFLPAIGSRPDYKKVTLHICVFWPK